MIHVAFGSTWKYFRGLSEASSPDPAAWRQVGFNAASWSSGPAPYGYGDPPLGTDLSLLTPPMSDNYTTLFLRREFAVADPSRVAVLELDADYDDGFVAWLNGVEVLRSNVTGVIGDPVAFDGLSDGDHESGLVEDFNLPDPPAGYLVAGTNVLAIQVFNATIGSSDLKLDVQLVDPLGADATAPAVSALVPAAGATVRSLERIEVTFTEEVAGVNAADILVRGTAAAGVTGSGAGPYVFTFAQPSPGGVTVGWAAGHGIMDLANPPNIFAASGWSYVLNPSAPPAELAISEILASNLTGLKDEDGEAEDWVEVQNRGAVAVNLAGYGLTDDPEEPGKWTLPGRVLEPGEYVVVFASGKDRKPASGNLHASFKLNSSGEYLGLYGAESPRQVLSEFAPSFPEQRADYSYGIDGAGGRTHFEAPTPGAPNAGGSTFAGFVRDPVASVPRGLYDAPLSVTLATPTPGAAIFYTLDGSEPTELSTPYTTPLLVEGTPQKAAVTLRAAAFKDGYLPSNAATFTYVFPDDVLEQSSDPSGFPTTWGPPGATTPADYAMDPLVVNNAAYTTLARDGLLSIPSLSIVTHVNNLFHPTTGIYANPSREGVAWERPVSAELISADSSESFQIDCGLRVQGGSSTEGWKALKVSLRLLFKDDYGHSKLERRFFSDSRVEKFDALVLDAGLNLTWNHPSHDQRVRSQYVRDQYVSDLQNATGGFAPHGRIVNLYLNGLYWGVYVVHERADDSFAAEYLGGDKSEYDVLKHTGSTLVSGNLTAWNTMMGVARAGLTANAQYEALQAHLDVPGLIDYMIVNIFAGNDDWPRHNWYATRRRSAGEPFRFHSWDAEHVLKDININQTSVNLANSPAELYSRLKANSEFKLLFADHVQRHFFGGGVLYVDPDNRAWDPAHPERNRPADLYMRRIAEIDPAIVNESARWGDLRRPGQPYTRDVEWMAELNWLRTVYFPQRATVVLNQLRSAGLYPTAGAPILSRNGGEIAPGFALAMSLPAGSTGTIYYTTDGFDPRVYGSGEVSPSAVAYASEIVLDDYAHIQARTLGSNGTWSALAEAIFTVPVPYESLHITEIMYNPEGGAGEEFLELRSLGSATLDLAGAHFTDGIEFAFESGANLAPGTFLVLVSDPAAFSSRYPGVPIGGVYSGSLSNGGEKITLKDARDVTMVSVDYDDGSYWPLGPDGFGYSLVLADTALDPMFPESWRASTRRGGSPGAGDPPPAPAGVVINEVLASGALPFEDAIELYNPASQGIDIGGWYLSDSRADEAELRKFMIPAGTIIAAGGFSVFYANQFNSTPGQFPSFDLPGGGGGVYLAAASGGVLTGYLTGVDFDASAQNVSFGRYETSAGTDFAALSATTFGADQAATVEEFRAGEGAPNALASIGPVVLNEIHYHPAFGDDELLELHNLTDSPIGLHDGGLGSGWTISGIQDSDGTADFSFDASAVIPARGYLLVVGIDPAAFRSIHGVPANVPIRGPYSGGIDNSGERIALFRPAPGGRILVDQVRYNDKDPWSLAPDGQGPSLERIRAFQYGNDPVNWSASSAAGGTPGAQNSAAQPPGGNLAPVATFTANPASGTAPLDVLLDASSSFDPDGTVAVYEWTFGDGQNGAGKTAAHTFSSPGTFRVALRVTDNQGAATGAFRTVTVGEPQLGGGQVPGDANQDGQLDIADPIRLIFHLFIGGPVLLPCGDGTKAHAANKALLDLNGDQGIDLSDVVYALNFLFRSGPAPVEGTGCVRMDGCPEACSP